MCACMVIAVECEHIACERPYLKTEEIFFLLIRISTSVIEEWVNKSSDFSVTTYTHAGRIPRLHHRLVAICQL